MADDSKDTRAETKFTRAQENARENAKAMAEHHAGAQAVREKTARLRSLRLAKEAADAKVKAEKKSEDKKKPAGKSSKRAR